MRLQRQQRDAELPETFGQLREMVLIIRLVRLPCAGHTGVQPGVRGAIGHRIKTRLREAGFQGIAHCDGHDLCCARQAPEGREMLLFEEVVEVTDEKDPRTRACDSLQLL